jgi:hypothetical protein
MNLELEKVKQRMSELERRVALNLRVRFFRVYYEVEYLEPVDLGKLLEDMVQSVALHRVYACFEEVHNKMFDNPVLKLSKYSYKITLWVSLHKPMDLEVFDKYFEKKLGKGCSEPIQRFDVFLEMAGLEKTKINRYFVVTLFGCVEEQKKVPKVLVV